MKKATLLFTLSFLLAFAVQLSATPAPAPHMKCRLDATAGKRASVHTTHIRKKLVKAKSHKPAPAKPQHVKAAKAKKEKAPKQSSAKPAKQHTSKPPKSSGQSHQKKTKSKGARHTTSATF